MTIFRAPLANYKGEVMLSMQATGVVPAGAVPFRGLWVTINGLVCATNDTGQARKYVGGFALEDPSGLLLVTETAPVNVPMDGINVNAAGAVVTKTGAGSVIHQGVGMTVSAPGGPIIVNKDEPPLTFYAGLERGINSAAIEGVGVRDSQATYREIDRTLRIAEVNEIRQEFQNGQPLGTLMEPASTNKCQNFNANPDAALTNMEKGGDASAVLSRVLDKAELIRAGLENVCISGYVWKLDNSAGSTSAFAYANGATGNTNNHIASAYARKDPASTGDVFVRIQGSGTPQTEVTAPTYSRIEANGAPTGTDQRFELACTAGGVGYFMLNQLEEQLVLTSGIITKGSAASRAVDQLQWSLTDPQGRNILNQAQGMVATLWRPSWPADVSFQAIGISYPILSLSNLVNRSLLYSHMGSGPQGQIRTEDTAAELGVDLTWQADTEYLCCVIWGTPNKQVGYKVGGSWSWSATAAYSGAYNETGNLYLARNRSHPSHQRNVYLWTENKGTAWLESFFSGVAN